MLNADAPGGAAAAAVAAAGGGDAGVSPSCRRDRGPSEGGVTHPWATVHLRK